MRLKLIRLLAVVIALVVPLQGMAVVVAGHCMAFGHHEAAAGHDSDGQAPDGQDGHDHAKHSHADDTAQSDESGGNGAHCGPCTACCASASISGPAGVSILSSPSNATYAFSQFPPIGIQPDGLDRPPLAL
jgi:hypothetical protein